MIYALRLIWRTPRYEGLTTAGERLRFVLCAVALAGTRICLEYRLIAEERWFKRP